MLKPRVMICLTLYDGVLTRTKNFRPDYRYTHNFVDMRHVDELVILDITPERKASFLETVEQITENYFGPLTLGGNLHSAQDAVDLIRWGCEKVVLKYDIEAASKRLGSQSICYPIDDRGQDIAHEAGTAEVRGAGEILYQSVERDGSLLGYDLDRIDQIQQAVSIPIVASTGCGSWQHLAEGFKAGASGAATACVFHWAPQTMKAFKDNIIKSGIPVRP